MASTQRQFILTVCQVGAERALKAEIGRAYPTLRPAFARPGLVTFKAPVPVAADVALNAVFVRAWAAALGPARTIEELVALAEEVRGGRPLRLHVWPREGESDDDTAPGPAAERTRDLVDRVRTALLASPALWLDDSAEATAGDHVFDVVVAPDEPFFAAHHLHGQGHSPWPGGRIPIVFPEAAPSRAYRKLEEGLRWSGAPLGRGDVAVEIGSAPGGASYALLERGLDVVGVDPGAMAPVVLGSPRFRHVQRPMAELLPGDLPTHVDWLLLDVNLAPQVALHSIRGVVSTLRPSLRGVLFTLKLNDWAMADEIPDLLRRIGEMQIPHLRATQLPSNRQEIFVYGLTSRGVAMAAAARRTKGR